MLWNVSNEMPTGRMMSSVPRSMAIEGTALVLTHGLGGDLHFTLEGVAHRERQDMRARSGTIQ